MGDVYHEYLLKRKITAVEIMLRVFGILLCVSGIVLFLFVTSYGAVLEVIFIYLTIWIFKRTDVELEYIFISGECQFDKIFGRSKRKGCGKLEIEHIEIMAIEGSPELENFEKANYRIRDFSSMQKDKRRYVAYTRKDSELIKIIFEPNDDILESMQMMAPRKILVKREDLVRKIDKQN